MVKRLLAVAAAALTAAKASALIVVPLGAIVVPPTQTASPGVTFLLNGPDSAYYEFFVSQPNTIGASSFINTAVGATGTFDFSSIALYAGTGTGGSLLETGSIGARIGGTEMAFLDPYTFGTGFYTIAYTGTVGNSPASVGSSITFAAGSVPEPQSWILLVAGFGLIGVTARRRVRSVAA